MLFRKNQDIILNLNNEIGGFRIALRRSQEEAETLAMLLGKLENEVDHLKRQIDTVGEKKERLMETYTMYTKTLDQAEKDLAQVTQVIIKSMLS